MVLLMVVISFVGASGAVILKKGLPRGTKLLLWKTWLRSTTLIGGALFFMGTLGFVYLLRSADLSFLYPLTSLSYIFIIILSAILLGEKMTKYKWLAVSLIITGNILIAL